MIISLDKSKEVQAVIINKVFYKSANDNLAEAFGKKNLIHTQNDCPYSEKIHPWWTGQ
jgi:hypothetical protein